jgi:hypothetical protein
VAVGCVLTSAGQALAVDRDIVNAAGFEETSFPHGFIVGDLEGQFNPPGFGQIATPGRWLRDEGGTSTAAVQTSIVKSGSQAVMLDRGANSKNRWGVPVSGVPEYPEDRVPPGEELQPCLCINWDMRVEGTGAGDGAFGPYFGVEANDDDVTGLSLLGSFGIDATTGEVLYQAPGTGFLTVATDPDTLLPVLAAFDTWYNYQIKLDYSTDEYTIIFEGKPLGSFAFVDGDLDEFSEANLFGVRGTDLAEDDARTGTAYFDNFVVREGMCTLIPEPTAIVLALIALALAPRIVRRQHRASL